MAAVTSSAYALSMPNHDRRDPALQNDIVRWFASDVMASMLLKLQ